MSRGIAGTSSSLSAGMGVDRTAETREHSASSELRKSTAVEERRNRVSLWHGLDLPGVVRLFRMRPELSLGNADRLLGALMMSGFNSAMNAASSLVYGRRLRAQPSPSPPIFILGHWRSGTTMLHNLLTLNQHLGFLNLYQCLFPGHFLLTEKVMAPLTRGMLSQTRPMDNMPLSWDLPQEDEMALCVATLLSPYVMIAFQDRMEVYDRFFDPREMSKSEQQRWKTALLDLLRKYSLRSSQIPVMKSPTHTFRVPTLVEMFPDAKFVYIYREPGAVIRSTVRLRSVMFSENSLGPLHPECWLGQTVDVYERAIRSYEDAKHLIPPEQLVEIRFEDLEAQPFDIVQQIHEDLKIDGWDQAAELVSEEVAGFKNYRKNSFHPDAQTDRLVRERLNWVYDLYDYKLNSVRVA